MPIADAIALLLMLAGALVTLVASVGLHRFPDVLTRMHAASKPQTLGLLLLLAGTAVALRSVAGVCLALLVMLAQMTTVPVSSTMMARAAFRRGFVRGAEYVVDELTPRLAHSLDADDDEDGFIDEDELGMSGEGFPADHDRFPTNRVGDRHAGSDLSRLANWDEEETAPLVHGDEIDIDESDLLDADEAEDAEIEAMEGAPRRRGRRRR